MSGLDDRIGQDQPTGLSPKMLAHFETLAKHHPHKLAAFVNGLAYSDRGLAAQLKSGLAPYMTLPPAEADRLVRARMAELIVIRCAAANCITHEDLLAGGFTQAEITKHFHAAKRAARVVRMAA
ncbi:MAG: hypothetical protein NTV97_17195 [Alphaproteobacteria bacterium]|nr:hypothetical protein [Alphaproteobacteria bacterium]